LQANEGITISGALPDDGKRKQGLAFPHDGIRTFCRILKPGLLKHSLIRTQPFAWEETEDRRMMELPTAASDVAPVLSPFLMPHLESVGSMVFLWTSFSDGSSFSSMAN
jgi:hypothetical protein